MESRRHAERRGAKIIAEVAGYSKSMDGYDHTNLHVQNVARTTVESLQHPYKKEFQKPDAIFAHATSTQSGDRAEAQVFYTVFEDLLNSMPITAIKSNLGHLVGGAGAVNLITAIQSIEQGVVPHILNLENPRLNLEDLTVPDDPIIDHFDFVRDQPRQMNIDSALVVAYWFGGHNASMLVRKPG